MSARMDMADLLTELEFAGAFTVARATETVDSHGRTQLAATTFDLVGVIQPAEPEALERLAEADRSGEVIAVYAPVLLTAGSATLAPDVVTWQGCDYRVKSVEDRMAAAGYCLALAVSVDMQGKEPAQ